MEEKELIERTCKSPEWRWLAKRFSTSCTEISIEKSREYPVIAWKVFEAMHLDLTSLSQIFVKISDSWSDYYLHNVKERDFPVAPDYFSLGLCLTWDENGWSALAVLTGKKILFARLGRGRIYERMSNVVAVYYPDGRVIHAEGVKCPG